MSLVDRVGSSGSDALGFRFDDSDRVSGILNSDRCWASSLLSDQRHSGGGARMTGAAYELRRLSCDG